MTFITSGTNHYFHAQKKHSLQAFNIKISISLNQQKIVFFNPGASTILLVICTTSYESHTFFHEFTEGVARVNQANK
jgi:hypothetical protein